MPISVAARYCFPSTPLLACTLGCVCTIGFDLSLRRQIPSLIASASNRPNFCADSINPLFPRLHDATVLDADDYGIAPLTAER